MYIVDTRMGQSTRIYNEITLRYRCTAKTHSCKACYVVTDNNTEHSEH